MRYNPTQHAEINKCPHISSWKAVLKYPAGKLPEIRLRVALVEILSLFCVTMVIFFEFFFPHEQTNVSDNLHDMFLGMKKSFSLLENTESKIITFDYKCEFTYISNNKFVDKIVNLFPHSSQRHALCI